MVRAGAVDHPKMWPYCGYNEIQNPPSRYRTIDLDILVILMGFKELPAFQSAHKKWVETSLQVDESKRESHWTESIAVGSRLFVENAKKTLGFKAKGRSINGSDDYFRLREKVSTFGNTSKQEIEPIAGADIDVPNTFFWDKIF
jgi:putative transposase